MEIFQPLIQANLIHQCRFPASPGTPMGIGINGNRVTVRFLTRFPIYPILLKDLGNREHDSLRAR